eukprot:1158127-Pelagomonas_calceolata.AAC.10
MERVLPGKVFWSDSMEKATHGQLNTKQHTHMALEHAKVLITYVLQRWSSMTMPWRPNCSLLGMGTPCVNELAQCSEGGEDRRGGQDLSCFVSTQSSLKGSSST